MISAAVVGTAQPAQHHINESGAVEDFNSYNVKLISCGKNRIAVMQLVRYEFTKSLGNISYVNVKLLIDNLPHYLKYHISFDEATEFINKLEEVGAIAALEPDYM